MGTEGAEMTKPKPIHFPSTTAYYCEEKVLYDGDVER
jgi:hypothetical protein